MPRRNHPRVAKKQRPRDRDAIQIHRLNNARPQRTLKCPSTPGKVRYKTLGVAEDAARRFKLLNDNKPQRAYKCPDCEGFHISSRPLKDNESGGTE